MPHFATPDDDPPPAEAELATEIDPEAGRIHALVGARFLLFIAGGRLIIVQVANVAEPGPDDRGTR